MKGTAVLMGNYIMMDKKRGSKKVKKRSEVHRVKQKRAEAYGNTKALLVFLKYNAIAVLMAKLQRFGW